MAGLDFRDLDQWIVDLDVLQQNRPNGWSSSSTLLFENGNQRKSGQSAVAVANLPQNHSNQSAERTGSPEFVSLERDILYHKSVSPSKLRTIPTTTDYRKHVCEPSPNENGLKVRYRINAASHDSYVCTNQKKGSRNLSRSGTLREQKSVHWSSEINSSTSPSTLKDGTCSPVSSDKKSSLSPANAVTTRVNKLQKESSFPADSSHRRPQGEPLEHNTASGTSRPDVIVTRSHSIKSAKRVPSRSVPFPSKFAFPMNLADFAKQKSVTNNTDITNVRNDSNQYSLKEFQAPYNCFPVSEPFKMSKHSIPFTVSPYEQYKQIPFTQSMVRSQSSVGKLHGFGNEKQFVLQDDRLKYDGCDGIHYDPKRRPQRSLSMHHSTADHYNGTPIQNWDPADLYPFRPPEVVSSKHTDKVGENLVRNYQNRQRLSNPLGIPICRPLSLFSTSLFDYHKPIEDKCNSPPDHQQFNTYPPNIQHPLQSHTTYLNMQVLPCSRPDVTDGRVSHQATKERCITLSTSSDSQPPQTCADPDATTGDASSIGWSASGSGCGLVGTSNPMGQRNTPSGLGCVSGRTDVRASRHSLSVSDLTQTVETTHTHTNCASSLTSLFLCTVNSDKRATQQYCNPSPNPRSDTGRARSKTVVKRLFGGGPSARRCNIGRSVSNISAPFNVSVPPWVRTSMNDLTLQVPSTNHLTMY
ncbi:hypothetical protein FGIG_04174 [Fasciola gigantica]|uniref:Uncharacterized protein n=1 Tax=Fasciola gigantica TaxID=46835 RepID=A0A504Y891_FASGI|nr:hypothetical protein FGIG_04174 [Fasciola gigantica]